MCKLFHWWFSLSDSRKTYKFSNNYSYGWSSLSCNRKELQTVETNQCVTTLIPHLFWIRFQGIFVTGRNGLHYRYDVLYQYWFALEEEKIYCNNFNSSNAVICSHLILAFIVRLVKINAAELERNGCFSLPLLRNVVLWLKRTSTKSLQIELVTKYDTNDA